jgi:MFS family permease
VSGERHGARPGNPPNVRSSISWSHTRLCISSGPLGDFIVFALPATLVSTANTNEQSVAGADAMNKVAHLAIDIDHDVDNICKDQEHGVHQQASISKVEAFNKALYSSGPSGRILRYVLVVSLRLTMFAYALDQGITYQFNAIAASAFSHHAELGAVNTASAIVHAISRPFLSKLSDITSRPTTYVVVLLVYALGFAVAASSQTLAAYIVGASFTAFGKSGLDLLSDIIVGDLTPLQWRAFWSSMLSTPFLITTFVNRFISDSFAPDNWRWGLGISATMIPVLFIPAIWTLYGMQHKAKKMGMVSMGDSGLSRIEGVEIRGPRQYFALAHSAAIEMDLVGLLLLGMAFSLVFLALNLAPSANSGWSNPSMIAMCSALSFLCCSLHMRPSSQQYPSRPGAS